MLSISYESVHFAPVTLDASVWSSYLFQFQLHPASISHLFLLKGRFLVQSHYEHTNRIQVLLFINCWFSDFHGREKAVLL